MLILAALLFSVSSSLPLPTNIKETLVHFNPLQHNEVIATFTGVEVLTILAHNGTQFLCKDTESTQYVADGELFDMGCTGYCLCLSGSYKCVDECPAATAPHQMTDLTGNGNKRRCLETEEKMEGGCCPTPSCKKWAVGEIEIPEDYLLIQDFLLIEDRKAEDIVIIPDKEDEESYFIFIQEAEVEATEEPIDFDFLFSTENTQDFENESSNDIPKDDKIGDFKENSFENE